MYGADSFNEFIGRKNSFRGAFFRHTVKKGAPDKNWAAHSLQADAPLK